MPQFVEHILGLAEDVLVGGIEHRALERFNGTQVELAESSRQMTKAEGGVTSDCWIRVLAELDAKILGPIQVIAAQGNGDGQTKHSGDGT